MYHQPVISHLLPPNFWMNWLILIKSDKRTWSQRYQVPTSFHENWQLSRRQRLTWVFPVRKILLCKLSNYLLCLTYQQADHCVCISHTICLHVIQKQSQVFCLSPSHKQGIRGVVWKCIWESEEKLDFSNERWMKKGAVAWVHILETRLTFISCNRIIL